MKIFTLGTSNRDIKDFLDILDFYQIKKVIDVRHWPTSKLFPHFQKENLKKFLESMNIQYYHLEKLGGFRKEGYQKYMETDEFRKGLQDLIEISLYEPTVIICAERLPWKCHRIFIAQKLEELGYEVLHIIEKGKIWNQKDQPKRIKPSCEKGKILRK